MSVWGNRIILAVGRLLPVFPPPINGHRQADGPALNGHAYPSAKIVNTTRSFPPPVSVLAERFNGRVKNKAAKRNMIA